MFAPASRRHRITTKSSNQMNNLSSQLIKIRKQIIHLERKVFDLEVENRRLEKFEKKVLALEKDSKRHTAAIRNLENPSPDLDDPEAEILI